MPDRASHIAKTQMPEEAGKSGPSPEQINAKQVFKANLQARGPIPDKVGQFVNVVT
ncbi:hypothetical protein [Hirschia maritima]|uniref:hypothetical protein n=1 Tax=Hirschia maritima TaxID=1121961 RepID=UPI00035FD467|nr:hypothetical protein [Hirschia maritima]